VGLKITELSALTTPVSSDVLVIVNDPAGTPISKKITVANLHGALVSAAANLTANVLIVGDDGAKGVKAQPGTFCPDYNEADQGLTGNGKSAKAYIDAIGADSATLVFRHSSGAATTTYTFSTSETISSNINVIVEEGVIFAGAGVITFPIGLTLQPEWWGAIGDASTDDYSAWAAMVSNAVAYKTTIELNGIYKLGTTLPINKSINIIGKGINTGFLLTMGAATNGITYGNVESGASTVKHSTWRDFGVYGAANSCLNAMVLTGMLFNTFERIHVMAGAVEYGVVVRWSIINKFNFISNQHYTQYPVSCMMPANGMLAQSSAGGVTTFIDNVVDVDFEAMARGIYLRGASDCKITGIAEGFTGYSLELSGGDRNHITNFYSEASAGAADSNQIVLTDETDTRIGAGVVSMPGSANTIDVLLVGSHGIVIDGLFCSVLSIDATTDNTKIQQITTTGQTASDIIDLGINTQQLNAVSSGYGLTNATGLFSDFSSIISNGSFERWTDVNTPAGSWGFISATATRETTIIKHGISSCKIDITGGTAAKFVRIIPPAIIAANPRGQTTFTGWVYIPTANGQDITGVIMYDGATPKGVMSVTTRDVWTKVSFTVDNSYEGTYTVFWIHLYNAEATNCTFYLDGWSAVPGVAGGASWFTPNANEFPKYTGSAVWDPGSIAADAQVSNDFTVLGAALGMVANAGAGVDVVDLVVSVTVTAADVVTVVLSNATAGAIDLASSTWRVVAMDISN